MMMQIMRESQIGRILFGQIFFRQMLDEEIYKNSGIQATAPDQTIPSENKAVTETAKLNEIKYFLKDNNIFDTNPEDLKNPSLNGNFRRQ